MFRASSYWFVGLFGAAMVAFWPMYLSKLPQGDRYTHTHAVLMTLWLGLLIVQPALIRSGQRALHRALGKASYLLVTLIVVASIRLTHFRARSMSETTFASDGAFFYLPLSMIGIFVFAYVLAVALRGRAPLHSRFMICTGLTLIDPAVARVLFFYFPPLPSPLLYQVAGFGLTDLVLVALIIRERGQRSGRAAFPVMLAFFAVVHLFWFTAGRSQGWLALVRGFRDLPLT